MNRAVSNANASVQDVPPFHVASGNPARILRRIETSMDKTKEVEDLNEDVAQGAEAPIASQD